MSDKIKEIYMVVIDDPTTSSSPDFEYSPCSTKEVAIKLILDFIKDNDMGEYRIQEDEYTDKELFLKDVRNSLEEDEYEEVNGVYYRILKLEMNY